MSQTRLVSTKSEMSWLVSCLDTSALANVSVSEKNVSIPSLCISTGKYGVFKQASHTEQVIYGQR